MTTNTERARLAEDAHTLLREASPNAPMHRARIELLHRAIDALAASPAAPSGDVPELPWQEKVFFHATAQDGRQYKAGEGWLDESMRAYGQRCYAAGRASAAPVEAVRWEYEQPENGRWRECEAVDVRSLQKRGFFCPRPRRNRPTQQGLTMNNDRQIEAAAKMAGEWWADRLDNAHAAKREEFAKAVANRTARALREDGRVRLECDYDPQDLLLEAVREVIAPDCSGVFFSARGILPQKHSLDVIPRLLQPKEGYGNWTAGIPVRVSEGS